MLTADNRYGCFFHSCHLLANNPYSFRFEAIPQDIQFLTSVFITTIAWVGVSLFTPPSNLNTLKDFYIKIQPGGKG